MLGLEAFSLALYARISFTWPCLPKGRWRNAQWPPGSTIPTSGLGGQITTFIVENFPDKSCSVVFNCHVLDQVYNFYRGWFLVSPIKVVIFLQKQILWFFPPHFPNSNGWIFVIIFELFTREFCVFLGRKSKKSHGWIPLIMDNIYQK